MVHFSKAESQAVQAASSETVTTLAIEQQCADVETFAGWLESASEDREPCAYFGPISTPGLVREIILNPNAIEAQLAAACRELRCRYLLENAGEVVARAAALAPAALPDVGRMAEYDSATQGVRNRGYA